MNATIKGTPRSRRYRIEELLYEKGGREFFLKTRNKILRKFNHSTSAWDKWLKTKIDAHTLGDFPPLILLEISKELELPMEQLFNTPKEKTEISL